MAFFCHQCGTPLPPNARFCSNCGAAIDTAASTAPFSASRRLVRPRVGRQIAGVCLALSRAYGWDPTVVRITAVLLLILSSGLIGIAYLAAWIGIPEEPLALPPAI